MSRPNFRLTPAQFREVVLALGHRIDSMRSHPQDYDADQLAAALVAYDCLLAVEAARHD